jgi:hypothetical protein
MPTLTNLLGSGNSALTAQASLGIINSSSALTATGSNQGTALALPSDFNVFTTVGASTGAILPANGANVNMTDSYIVVNHGASTLSVYPPTGGKIANGSANAAFSVAAGKTAWFLNIGSGNWAASVSA